MPIQAHAADNTVHEFPDDTPPEVVDRVMKAYASEGKPSVKTQVLASVPARVAAGVADPLVGANALYDKIVGNTGQFVTSAGGMLPNAVSDWFGKAANSGQTIANQETQGINQARQQMGARPGATDWARIGGNVISPLNSVGAPARGAGIAANIAHGALIGATQPVDTSSAQQPPGAGYTGDVLKNMGIGGAVSGALSGAARGIQALRQSPEAARRAAQVQALQDYGVQPSIGQQFGGSVGAAEEKLSSVPVVGDILKNAQVTRPTAELNRGVYNDVLGELGQQAPEHLAIGRPSVDHVNNVVNGSYNEILPQMSLPADSTRQAILDAHLEGQTLLPERRDQLQAWTSRILASAGDDGIISGQDLKGLTSDIRKAAVNYSSDPSSDARDLGQALHDLHGDLTTAAAQANPELAPRLAQTDAAYTKLIRLNKAASSVGAKDGVFSPAQLNSAVLTSVSKRNAAKASGRLPMQEISDAAQTVLGSKVPNSGTTDRGLLAAALIGAPAMAGLAASHPLAAAGVVGGIPALAGAYTRGGQRALGSVQRQAIINALQNSGPYASRGATALFGGGQ